MEDDAAEELDVVVAHFERAVGDFADEGESVGKD